MMSTASHTRREEAKLRDVLNLRAVVTDSIPCKRDGGSPAGILALEYERTGILRGQSSL